MPEFTSISKLRTLPLMALTSALCLTAGWSPFAFSQTGQGADPKAGRTQQPEEDDFQGSPYTQYGEFNENEQEEEETRFLQRGRLFGLSVGMGSQFTTGNRGQVYQGGFPLVDVRLHYWFDFHLALDLQFTSASQFYEVADPSSTPATPVAPTRVDVGMTRLGGDFKYYFDVSNLAAPITFAGPYVLAGVAAYSQSKTSGTTTADTDTAIGVDAGFGFEFPIKPRHVYLNVEGKMHFMNFRDTYTTQVNGLTDLSGLFWTATAGLLLTW